MIHSLLLKAAQASKMADNYQMADPTLSRVQAIKIAIKVQEDMTK